MLDQHLCHPAVGAIGVVRVHTPLEAARRLGVECVPLGGEQHAGRVEVCGFDDDRRRLGPHLAVAAAHHPADPHGHSPVRDDDVVGVELSLHLVEGDDALAGLRPPHDDLGAEEVAVEDVVGVAQLEHHVVGDVDDVVDRPHPAGLQPKPHPERRRADFDPAHLAGGEARASHRVLQLHRHSRWLAALLE